MKKPYKMQPNKEFSERSLVLPSKMSARTYLGCSGRLALRQAQDKDFARFASIFHASSESCS